MTEEKKEPEKEPEKMRVDVGNFFPNRKGGALKALFSVALPLHGLKILDCKLFEFNGKRWIQFPCKEIKRADAIKTEYIPYISFADKAYHALLQEAILEAIKIFDDPKELTYAKSDSYKAKTAFVPLKSSPLPF